MHKWTHKLCIKTLSLLWQKLCTSTCVCSCRWFCGSLLCRTVFGHWHHISGRASHQIDPRIDQRVYSWHFERLINECTADTVRVIIIIIITTAHAGTDSSNLPNNSRVKCHILKQNEPESVRAETTHKGVNQGWTNVTRTQQRPESPTVTLTWHASKYKAYKLHQRYTLSTRYINSTRGISTYRM